MTKGLTEYEFAEEVKKYRDKTRNYPWANPQEHEKGGIKEARRLLNWVFPPYSKDKAWGLAFIYR